MVGPVEAFNRVGITRAREVRGLIFASGNSNRLSKYFATTFLVLEEAARRSWETLTGLTD